MIDIADPANTNEDIKLLRKFLDIHKKVDRTYKIYFLALSRFYNWLVLNNLTLAQVNKSVIQNYAIFLTDIPENMRNKTKLQYNSPDYKPFAVKCLSHSSIQHQLTIINSFYLFTTDNGYIEMPYDLCVSAKRAAKIGAPKKPFSKYLTFSQTKDLLKVVANHPRNNWIIKLLLYQGLRIHEAVIARMSDVFLKYSPTMNKNAYYLNIIGKGNNRETVLICPAALEAFLQYRHSLGLPDVPNSNEYASLIGVSYEYARDIVTEAGKQIGINNLSPHWLRHTCASLLILNGAPVCVVQHHLRHKDIKTTMMYVHAFKNEMEGKTLTQLTALSNELGEF